VSRSVLWPRPLDVDKNNPPSGQERPRSGDRRGQAEIRIELDREYYAGTWNEQGQRGRNESQVALRIAFSLAKSFNDNGPAQSINLTSVAPAVRLQA